jgi:precorrin-6B methylase 1
MRVLPMPSSCALAAARLGWPLQDVQVVSLVARPLAALNAHLFSGLRLLVLSNDGTARRPSPRCCANAASGQAACRCSSTSAAR